MVTDFSFVGLIKGTWNQVSTAFWQKYPNPYSTNVLTEDVIFREVTPDNRLLSRRLLTKTGPVPRWAESFFTSFTAYYVIEDSVVDPVNKTMVTFTRNISHTHFISWLDEELLNLRKCYVLNSSQFLILYLLSFFSVSNVLIKVNITCILCHFYSLE
uniref:PRELI domain containing 1a n=1 Tax=Astyanax mexicanus TaxID=7994 RepID=A0A3B1K6Q1_ASTMX